MHKNTKLLPYQRREAFRRWKQGETITELAKKYEVSRETIYRLLRKAKRGIFINLSSKNYRYRSVYYGIKQLSRTEERLAKKLARRAHRLNRYEKAYPGEMVHFDSKKLPLLSGESIRQPREHLFVAIDDHSRQAFADIFPDKTSYSSAIFLDETIAYFPYRIEESYSDNGSEFKGRETHPFVMVCNENRITQKFTKPRHPQTNGKAERLIQTIMRECLRRGGRSFYNRDRRRKFLYAWVSWYNQTRPHESLGNKPPISRLEAYLDRVKSSVNNA